MSSEDCLFILLHDKKLRIVLGMGGYDFQKCSRECRHGQQVFAYLIIFGYPWRAQRGVCELAIQIQNPNFYPHVRHEGQVMRMLHLLLLLGQVES